MTFELNIWTSIMIVIFLILYHYLIKWLLVYKSSKLLISDYASQFPEAYRELELNKLTEIFESYKSNNSKGFVFYYDIYILAGLNKEFIEKLVKLCEEHEYDYSIKVNIYTQLARITFIKLS